jgi:hypothetical protein
MLFNALQFFSIYLFSALILFGSGFAFLLVFKHRIVVIGFFSKVFAAGVFGLITLVFLHSVFRSGTETVNVVLLLFLFLLLYKNRIHLRTSVKTATNAISIVVLLLAVLLPFLYYAAIIYKKGTFFYAWVDYDNVLYARLSDQLRTTGSESRWLNLFPFDTGATAPVPYHYFDLWLNALWSHLFQLRSLPALYLVTYPQLVLIGLSGILAMVELKQPVGFKMFLIGVLLFLIGPVYGIKNYNYHFNTAACEIPLQHYGEKFAVYYPFIIMALLLALNGLLYESLLFATSLCIVSFTVFPAIFIFCCAALVLFRRDKAWSKSASIKLLLLPLGLLLFYVLHDSLLSGTYSQLTFLPATSLNLKGKVVDWLIGITKTTAYFLGAYCYLPLLLGLFYFGKSRDQLKKVAFFFLFPLCGLIAASTLSRMIDNYQLFTNTLPFLHILVICLLILFYSSTHQKNWRYTVVTSLLLLNGIYTLYLAFAEYRELQTRAGVSDSFMNAVLKQSANIERGSKIGFIYSQRDWEDLYTASKPGYLYHLAYTNFDPLPVKLSCVDVDSFPGTLQQSSLLEKMNRLEPFYQYFYNQIAVPGQNPGSVKWSFLRNNGIEFILLGPQAQLPVFLEKKVSKALIDSLSGIKLAVLNKE